MEQTFGRMGDGVGLGGLMAAFCARSPVTVIGSMIAQQFFSHEIGFDAGGTDSGRHSGADENQDAGDYGFDDASGEMDADDFGDV